MSSRDNLRCLALGLLLSCSCAASADGPKPLSPPAIRWDLALINGLEVSAESLGIHDRIRVVTLGTSGCTPGSARLFTINPESGTEAVTNLTVQGRSIEFEIETTARPSARLQIDCKERRADGGPSRTFTLALEARKAR